MRNLNLLFNKTYYDGLTASGFSGTDEMNRLIFNTQFSHQRDFQAPGAMISHSFILTVCYPGLLVGIGNTHDSGMGDEEIGVGFSFDYVTGQPYIPGSSVKGVLRSHFTDHPQVIMDLCQKDRAWVRKLETEIFDYSDVFFDAVVYDGDAYGLLMGAEFITPHKSPTENPIPIKLIKVLPDVRFSFRFQLHDSQSMSAAEKETLLRKLLCLFGIGAKTNVGFGILKEDETNGELGPKLSRRIDSAPASRNLQQRGNQSGGQRRNQQRPISTENTAAQDSKKCPHCGRWNKRVNPNTGKENWNWRQNICFSCKEKMQ